MFWLQNQMLSLRKSLIYTQLFVCVCISLNVSGTIFKQNKTKENENHENWLNTVSSWFPQVLVWVWIWVCVSIQNFRQIYFHNLNFCELDFLTHPLCEKVMLEISYVLFVPRNFLAFFSEKK